MKEKLAFAVDIADGKRAQELIDILEDYVGAFKIGLEYFIANGRLPLTKKPIILDLKLHDIPATVERAVKSSCDLGAQYLTLHIQQRAALELAVKAAEPYGVKLLGVSVLSSMEDKDLWDLDFIVEDITIADTAFKRIGFARACGLRGFVCSPQEIQALKRYYPDNFFLVPGVRSIGADIGDQKRTGTPAQAIKDGANLIVVGRPIRDANDPVEAAKLIVEEMCKG